MQRVYRRSHQTSSGTSMEIIGIDAWTPAKTVIVRRLPRDFVTANSMVRKHGPNHGCPGSGHPGSRQPCVTHVIDTSNHPKRQKPLIRLPLRKTP
ncbi:hypothetical protein GJ496_008077 [Pomphorhynchus laevis]|nr:hypothetical protein GJ496_008077 [Pomphorhynchus laevis]